MSQKCLSVFVVLTSTVIGVLVGCAPVTVQQTTLRDTLSAIRADVVTTGELSQMTRQVLRTSSMQALAQEPERAFQALDAFPAQAADDERQAALVEIALFNALQHEASQPNVAIDWYLLAAARSYDFLWVRAPHNPLFNSLYERMWIFYLRALASLVEQLKKTQHTFVTQQRMIQGVTYTLEVASGPDVFDPNTFDELFFGGEFTFGGLTNRYRRGGLGIPLVGFQHNKHSAPADHFFPKAGTARTVTVLVRFDPTTAALPQRHARLYFYDALQVEHIELNGVQVPLGADFTAPFGMLVSRTGLQNIGLSQTLRPENWISEAGFYMTEPFDPHKIPIITVHGLLSSPITWINVQNDLMADPLLRQHYQMWHFYYPAGLPVVVSAQLFREKLEDLYNFFDPHGELPALRQTVVIAHSMGGLLTKTVVSDSGEHLADYFFTQPLTDLKLTLSLREQLDRLLRFHRESFITRVIFIAVPHRGSSLAESFAGKIGRLLIAVPATALLPARLLLEQAGALLTPDARASLQEKPNSIKSLSPHNPLIQALAAIAIDRGVVFHSIIGDRGLGGGAESSDGIVPYQSSHLEGAESELVVPAGHSAHEHPLAILEIKRILRLHLQQLEQSGRLRS